MAGEVLVLNPRRRRRKARATAKRRRRRVVRHHTRARVHNPRRRRRVHSRRRRVGVRRRRRSVRHNPGMGRMFGINLGQVAMVAGGGIVTEVLADKLAAVLPPSWKTATNVDMVRIGTKAAVGIGLPMLARKFLPRGWGSAIALGGGIVTLLDIFKTYIAPKLGITLTSYEIGPYGGVSSYEMLPGGMAGLTEDGNIAGGAYAGSVYGN